MQQLTSIDIFWRQLTNVNMTSIVILSSSLTSIDVKWLDASVMTNFDVLWRLWRFLTSFDVFWRFSKFKNFEKFYWRKLTKIDENWRLRQFLFASIDVNWRQLTSISVSWGQYPSVDDNWRQYSSIDDNISQFSSIFVGWRQNNLNLCKISIIFQIILYSFILNSLFKWKKI